MMLDANLKSTAVVLIIKKYFLLVLGIHISHNFRIHIDNKYNYYIL